jgi:hypothetical protein
MNLKKIISALALGCFILSSNVQAQDKIIEGKAIFNLEFPTEGMDEQYKAMMPKEATIYFKEGKTRTEMDMSMMTMVNIYNDKDKTMTMLMDMMGKKTATKMDIDKVDTDKKKYTVTKTDETATIAGYKCYKALVADDEGTKVEVWYTKDIIGNTTGTRQFKEIEGFLMRYEVPVANMDGNMKMECKSVQAQKVSDDMFVVPAGYELKSQEDLMKGK